MYIRRYSFQMEWVKIREREWDMRDPSPKLACSIRPELCLRGDDIFELSWCASSSLVYVHVNVWMISLYIYIYMHGLLSNENQLCLKTVGCVKTVMSFAAPHHLGSYEPTLRLDDRNCSLINKISFGLILIFFYFCLLPESFQSFKLD